MFLRDMLVKEKSMKLTIKTISLLLCVFTLFVVGCADVAAPTPTGTMPSQDITPALPTPSEKPTPTPKPTRSPEPTPAPTANEAYRLKGEVIEIASFKIGAQKDRLAYDPTPAPMTVSGPSSFYVDESGWLAVLDTYNSRIAIFEKSDGEYKYSDEIRFEDDGMMFLMEYINGTFYVLNYTVDYMFTVDYVYGEDNSTKEIKKHSFPEDMFITPIMEPLSDGVYLTNGEEDYWFVDGEFMPPDNIKGLLTSEETSSQWSYKNEYKISLDGHEWEVSFDDDISLLTVGTDRELNLVLGMTTIDLEADAYTMLTLDIYKYDKYGNELGSVKAYDCEDIDRFPWQEVRVLPDGRIYLMACHEDRVCFYEIR